MAGTISPPNFDPSKKYPMVVYYYGGTIPLDRVLDTTYDLAMFAAQGYVAYSLNPRGTVGYGQSFAADHLNAWGTKTADDSYRRHVEGFCRCSSLR